MSEDLDGRLRRLSGSRDAGELIDLGCDLAEAGRERDAEHCFRRAAGLGDVAGFFPVGNALAARGRTAEAMQAYERALADGEVDAWRTLGPALEQFGDDPVASAVLACWRWCNTLDPALEPDLRAVVDHFPPARTDLAELLRRTGRSAEARWVLERGAKLGERESWLPLGNLYADELGDVESAEEAYRSGIAAGDPSCHHGLAVLLAERGDLEGAVEHLVLGARAGDQLAAQALRDLGRG